MLYQEIDFFSLKRGLKKFKETDESAVSNELEQFHMAQKFAPLNASDLKEKGGEMGLLVFLKEKRYGSIKGRSCAYGRTKLEGPNKVDATSPTVSLRSVLITVTINAFENQDVAIVDVPSA
jgi:hypothetical protein